MVDLKHFILRCIRDVSVLFLVINIRGLQGLSEAKIIHKFEETQQPILLS
jgi:hypothetical protein